jgi:plasmid stability protein
MATLYVENIPDELYEALRQQARQRRKSIAAEVLRLIEENIPTPAEMSRRQEFFERVLQVHANPQSFGIQTKAGFPTSEEMQREDRLR